MDAIAALPGFQAKSAAKLVAAVDSARASATVGDVLYALSVPSLGKVSASAVGDALGGGLDAVAALGSLAEDAPAWVSVGRALGPSALSHLRAWLVFDGSANARVLLRLHALGVCVSS